MAFVQSIGTGMLSLISLPVLRPRGSAIGTALLVPGVKRNCHVHVDTMLRACELYVTLHVYHVYVCRSRTSWPTPAPSPLPLPPLLPPPPRPPPPPPLHPRRSPPRRTWASLSSTKQHTHAHTVAWVWRAGQQTAQPCARLGVLRSVCESESRPVGSAAWQQGAALRRHVVIRGSRFRGL